MATQITVNGSQYSIGKMDAMKQFHVSRRIGPMLPSLAAAYAQMLGSEKPLVESIPMMLGNLKPALEALASMPDDEVEYVMSACLSVVQRQQPTGWAAVWSQQGKIPMFSDIELPALLELVANVIADNLGPFMAGLLTSQPSGTGETVAG